jgi:hypothetical protein
MSPAIARLPLKQFLPGGCPSGNPVPTGKGNMTETPVPERGLGRRSLLRSALITGAGAVTLGAMSIPLASAARAGTYQSAWAWCTRCNAIFWASNEFVNTGACPGNDGDPHDYGSNPTTYAAMYGFSTSGNPADTSSSGQQAGWAWCSACSMLGWKANGGCCEANSKYADHLLYSPAAHSYGDTNYAIPFGVANSNYQPGWVYCSDCAVLYWGGTWGSAAENCAGKTPNGKHTPGSDTHYQFIIG